VSRTAIIVGVISDTHGLLRPEATEALKGSDLIVHAGDVGGAQILEQLLRCGWRVERKPPTGTSAAR